MNLIKLKFCDDHLWTTAGTCQIFRRFLCCSVIIVRTRVRIKIRRCKSTMRTQLHASHSLLAMHKTSLAKSSLWTYDSENSIHTPAQPFNEQNKASGIIFVDIRKVHDHISTTWILKASRLSAQDPHPLCVQQGLLLMTDFKDRSHWSIHIFVSPRGVSRWCNAERLLRLCGCNDVLSSGSILGILIPEP